MMTVITFRSRDTNEEDFVDSVWHTVALCDAVTFWQPLEPSTRVENSFDRNLRPLSDSETDQVDHCEDQMLLAINLTSATDCEAAKIEEMVKDIIRNNQ